MPYLYFPGEEESASKRPAGSKGGLVTGQFGRRGLDSNRNDKEESVGREKRPKGLYAEREHLSAMQKKNGTRAAPSTKRSSRL